MSSGQKPQILDPADAAAPAAGEQAFTGVGSAAFTGSARQPRTFEQGCNRRVVHGSNGDGVADLVFALTLANAAPSGAGDFTSNRAPA